MASVIPKEVKKEIIDTWIAETGAWNVALFQTGSNCETQALYSGCTTPAVGTGYAVQALAGRSSNYDGSNAYLDATDSQWTGATFSARYAVVYNTSTSRIKAVFDFGTKSVTGGTFTIQWNASGLIKIS